MKKKIIAVDFDGVLHSFSSGWQGARTISDLPTDGAVEWLKHLIRRPHLPVRCCPEYHIKVVIYSARLYHWGGKRAIKKWLWLWGLTKQEISMLGFVRQKPVCQFILDDRVVCFRGKFPSDHEIINFRPWHGQSIWGDDE